jgi:tetratricopeptide (TPR) repeat protein
MILRSLATAATFLALSSIVTAQMTQIDGRMVVTVAEAPWSLSFPADDFSVREMKVSPDGFMGYLFVTSEKSGLNVSFYIEPAKESTDPAELRDLAWDREKGHSGEATDVVKRATADYAAIEYTYPEIKGVKINQKNMRMHFVRDGYWIDMHISKVLYEEADRASFDAFVKSIAFAPKAPKQSPIESEVVPGSADDYWLKGSAAYMQQDYEHATEWYTKALDLEKKKRSLKDEAWRVLIDNLGMAQAMTGNLESARQTFAYGVSQDSVYPMFYYNLACTHAELGNLDESMAYLKQAFKFRQNVIAGEEMPDPETDSSFQKYLKEKRFLQTMKEIRSQGK